MGAVETIVERVLFASRWLLAPIYLGLAIALVPLVFGFLKELWHLIVMMPSASEFRSFSPCSRSSTSR